MATGAFLFPGCELGTLLSNPFQWLFPWPQVISSTVVLISTLLTTHGAPPADQWTCLSSALSRQLQHYDLPRLSGPSPQFRVCSGLHLVSSLCCGLETLQGLHWALGGLASFISNFSGITLLCSLMSSVLQTIVCVFFMVCFR